MIYTLMATYKRNHKMMQRAYPWAFFIGSILSGFYIVVFAYLMYHFMFNNQVSQSFSHYSGTNDYLSYVVVGAIFYSITVSLLMIVSRSLITEYREGTLEPLLLSPSSRLGYFIGAAFQGLTRVSIELISITIIGILFGLKIEFSNLFLFFILLIFYCCAVFSQAIILGSIMLYFRDTYLTQNTLFMVMYFINGIFFPIQYLPTQVQQLSHIFPLTYGLEGFRKILLNHATFQEVSHIFLILVVQAIVYFAPSLFIVKKMEKRMIEKHI